MANLQAFFDKVVTYNIKSLHLCSHKDLLGLITEDDSLIILRISHQPKKVATLDESLKIETISFKQDGTGLVLSNTDGQIKVYHLESMSLTLIHEINIHTSSVQFLKWHTFPRQFPNTTFPIEAFYPFEKSQNSFTDLSIILAVDSDSTVSMTINGVYPLALFTEAGCKKLILNKEITELYLLKIKNDEWFIEKVDICIIEKKAEKIKEISEIFERCQEYFKVLGKGCKEVVKEINGICSGYFQKYLNGIQDCIESLTGNVTVEELLCTCAATGVFNSCLNKFIKEEMQNVKAISQYEEKLAIQVKNCQVTLLQQCKNSINCLIFYLNTLDNYSKVPQYGFFHLKSLNLVQFIEKLEIMLEKTNKTMELLSDAHLNIKNMIHWLHNWNLRLVKEEEQAEAPEEWAVDLKQLMIYLENQDNLKFADLTKIIKFEFLNDLNLILSDWQGAVKKIPTNFTQYFKKKENFSLGRFTYTGYELELKGESVFIGLFDKNRVDLFELKSGHLTSFALEPGISIKYLKIYENLQVLIAGGLGNKSVLQKIDKNGLKIGSGEYGNEEVSALDYNGDRMVAALVTNERTLRIFDFEEI